MGADLETYLQISFLNDFVFCPLSIYFHQLYGNLSTRLYQDLPQINGKAAHAAIDEKRYSTHKNILQGVDVYSDKYKLCGKIDIFDITAKTLTERKKRIVRIYDGYIFQLYSQYYCLKESGYDIEKIRFYSSDDNKIYPVNLPEEDEIMSNKFEQLIQNIAEFDIDKFKPQNEKKCQNCIYENFCDRSLKC